ncbi:hypothetical protein KIPB_010653, partial [Kipferlia bialata]
HPELMDRVSKLLKKDEAEEDEDGDIDMEGGSEGESGESEGDVDMDATPARSGVSVHDATVRREDYTKAEWKAYCKEQKEARRDQRAGKLPKHVKKKGKQAARAAKRGGKRK